jgi:hypothetical protein
LLQVLDQVGRENLSAIKADFLAMIAEFPARELISDKVFTFL